jgi:hypothetical protein
MLLRLLQDDWLKRAELAVSKGEDELAREALKRRKAYQVSPGGGGGGGGGVLVVFSWCVVCVFFGGGGGAGQNT